MNLNIKDEETCQLAKELARLTGRLWSVALTVALRERLEREKQTARHGCPRSRTACYWPTLR